MDVVGSKRLRIRSACAGLLVGVLVLAQVAAGSAFVAAPGSPYAVGTGPVSIATGDFNDDGYPDLATANVNGGFQNISVLVNDGAGGFAAASFWAGTSTHPRDIAVEDFNGDGRDDIVTLNDEPLIANQQGIPDSVSVLLGDGDGGFAAPIRHFFGPEPTSVAVGEFNGDGNADLAITNTVFKADVFENEVIILLGTGTGQFDKGTRVLDRVSPYPFAGGGATIKDSPASITVADFNGDGKDDFAFANGKPRTISLWLGDGAGEFAAAPGSPIPMPLDVAPFSLTVGDVNADGRLDLAVTHFNVFVAPHSRAVAVLLGNGSGAFAPAPSSPFWTGTDSFTPAIAIADFDADGRPDLATANVNSDNVSVLLGDGAGAFAPTTGSPFAAGDGPSSIVAADFNRDGRDDMAVSNVQSDSVTVLLNSDTTPPTIVPSVSGTLGGGGWYVSDVTVSWSVTDPENAVSSTSGCGTTTLTADTAGTTLTCTATSAGGTASESVTVKIDKTPPSVVYTGNAGTYTVDQQIAITCTASDALSGIDSHTCADVAGPAYTFPLGTNIYSARALDRAGNEGFGSTTFTVEVTYASLCNLTRRFSSNPGVADSLCKMLAAAEDAEQQGNLGAKDGQLSAYRNLVDAQSGKAFTAEEAEILVALADAL